METEMANLDICGFCNEKATKKCSACRQISYCSQEHQKQHWKSHKKNCKPFMVQKNVKKGRYLSAVRDIKAEELILKEVPLIIGPKFVSPYPVCLGCLKMIHSVSSSIKCSSCGWPVCNFNCAQLPSHKLECDLLALEDRAKRRKFQYELITPIRCLLQMQVQASDKWNIISKMEAHHSFRMEGSEAYEETENLYSYLTENILKNSEKFHFSRSDFHLVCGILDVNSLNVPYGSIELSALYSNFSNMEHNCMPNCKISFKESNVIVRASKHISVGDNLSTTYTNILWGTHLRQQHLYSTKYFTCTCARCLDPTELGTNFGSIKCLQDHCHGFLLLGEPTKMQSYWKCNKCSITMQHNDAEDILSRIGLKVDEILQNNSPDVQNIEKLLSSLESVLHPHHYNCFLLKHSVIQLYGHKSGYDYCDLDNQMLCKKIEYCKELLYILSYLDPEGCRTSMYIAIAKYELAATMIEEMKRTLRDTMNLNLITENGKKATSLLSQAVNIVRINNSDNAGNNKPELIQQHCLNLYQQVKDLLNGNHDLS